MWWWKPTVVQQDNQTHGNVVVHLFLQQSVVVTRVFVLAGGVEQGQGLSVPLVQGGSCLPVGLGLLRQVRQRHLPPDNR